MQRQILMPALSPAMTDGRIAKWHVSEGQSVAVGDVIAEIVSATATMEIEAKSAGRVEKLLVPAGTACVKVNTPIAVIRAERVRHETGRSDNAPSPPMPEACLRQEGGGETAWRAQVAETADTQRAARGHTQVLTYREALRDALAEEMRRDPDVFVLGAEVAQNRGAQKVCRGLLDEFGPARVVTTPALEEALTGLAIGAALAGLRPIVEFTSWAVALSAIDLILGDAAATSYVSGGAMTVPIVFRGRNGWSPGAAGPDSRCFASLLAQVPGLKVLAPSSPADAKGLLKAAIRDPGPVVLLEHERLYAVPGPVPTSPDWLVEIGSARIARAGRSVSIVAYGRAVATALEAAGLLAAQGIDAEVVDLRTLRPLDIETVLASVWKTRRLVTVEDGWPQGSIGSEIAATVVARAFGRLAAPPGRVAGADIPMPYAESLEALALPDSGSVIAGVKAALDWN
jgi:pyruvate dehydrogenase E1 component beta subunit